MVQLINLGGVKSINGKTVLNGSNSGIDTAGLVDSLAKVRSQPAVDMQTKITANQTKITALNKLKTLMTNFQTSLDTLRNPGGLDSSKDVFAARSPFVTMTDGSTSTNYLGITTANGAAIGKYSVAVDHLATAQKDESVSFADKTSSATARGGFTAGDYTINGQKFTINNGDNLNSITSAINSVSSQSNVTASIVQYSSTDFRIVLNDKKTGAANTIELAVYTPPNSPIEAVEAGMGGINDIFSVKQVSQDAQIQFDGETVTRSSNTISDLVSGVTFSLYQPTPAGAQAILDIDKDDATIAAAIGNFVDNYNALKTFQSSQKAVDADGKLLGTSVLASDPTLNTIIDKLSGAIGSQVSEQIPDLYTTSTTTAPVPTRIGDLGIYLATIPKADDIVNPDGTTTPGNPAVSNGLTLDAAKIAKALQTNFDDVKNIFQFNFNSSSDNFSVYKRDNTVMNTNFNITIDTSQPNGSKALLHSIDDGAFSPPIALTYTTVNGQTTISGPVGSALADFSFTYSGNGHETIDRQATLPSKGFSITVDATQPAGSQAQVTGAYGYSFSSPIALNYTASGGSALIQGASGSPFAGLQVIYTGTTTGPQTSNISISQGIADSLYNTSDNIIKGTALTGSTTTPVGLIDAAINSLTDSDTKLQASIVRINDQVTSYRTQLLTRFSKLESAIGSANQLLTLLSAQSDARNNS